MICGALFPARFLGRGLSSSWLLHSVFFSALPHCYSTLCLLKHRRRVAIWKSLLLPRLTFSVYPKGLPRVRPKCLRIGYRRRKGSRSKDVNPELRRLLISNPANFPQADLWTTSRLAVAYYSSIQYQHSDDFRTASLGDPEINRWRSVTPQGEAESSIQIASAL
jgi:hypothetical protein